MEADRSAQRRAENDFRESCWRATLLELIQVKGRTRYLLQIGENIMGSTPKDDKPASSSPVPAQRKPAAVIFVPEQRKPSAVETTA